MVLFADDTSILVTDSNKFDFNIIIKETFVDINTWFRDSLISMNFNKIQYLQCRTKHYNVNTKTEYNQEYITIVTTTKFLELIIDDTLSWKQRIDQVVSKMCTACCAIQNITFLVSQGT